MCKPTTTAAIASLFRGHRTNGYLSRLLRIDIGAADHTILMMVMRNHRRKNSRQTAKQTNSIFSFFAHIRLNLADKGKGDYFRGVIQFFLFSKFKYSTTLHNGKYISAIPYSSKSSSSKSKSRIESIIGILRFEELLHLTTVSFRRSSQSFLAIDKNLLYAPFRQFVLFRRSDILQMPGN